ncbi:MAG: amidohydrolase [Planctomycetota bacterium]|nr:amidohydrolase [Planctomycetota bacterium]
MSNESPGRPHAPDVAERRDVDHGFSAGWGLHFQPSVKYWLDCHTHMSETRAKDALKAVADWHDTMWAFRLRRHVAVDGFPERAEALAAAARGDDRFLWLCRMKFDAPDVKHLERCKELGAVGLKLHNAPLIQSGAERRSVLSAAWQAVYARAGELGMPVLWHVTQRHTASPYTGGGLHSYWKEGWKNGVTYTNEELLGDFLEAVAAHRGTTFIGAHQLHIGPERMAALFAAHPNLVVDTSIGCYVAPDDEMYEEDRVALRAFFLAHADRLLFGSDVVLDRRTANTELLRQHFLGHVRFIKQLRLPQEELTKIAHANFERLAGLAEVQPFEWGALRP